MSELDKALDRLGDAVTRLVAGAAGDRESDSRLAELAAERDALQAELDELRGHREEDAKLRAEAADAVRDALRDLRSLVAANGKGDGKAGDQSNG